MSMAQAGDLRISAEGVDADTLARTLDARDHLVARFGQDEGAEQSPMAVLRIGVGGRVFGVPLDAVAGVTGLVRPSVVPGTTQMLLGMAASRGWLYSVFAIDAPLGLPRVDRAEVAMLLLREPRPRVALAIDEALDVAQTLKDELDETLPLLRLVVADGGSTLSIINLPLLLSTLGVRAA